MGDGYNQTLDVTECAATFTGTNLNTAYTFMVAAEGLSVPLSVSLPANATVITSLEAEAVDAGSIEVVWANSEPQPEDGWLVRYLVGGDEALSGSTVVTEGNSAVLRGLPPKSEIVVMLQATSGAAIIGEQAVTVMMPEAAEFTSHDFVAGESEMKLYALPAQESWGYDDLEGAAEAYDPGVSVAVVLKGSDSFAAADSDETAITLVIRTENGNVVAYDAVSRAWNEIWQSGRYLTSLKLPQTPGSYQVELYFDGCYVNRCALTVNG